MTRVDSMQLGVTSRSVYVTLHYRGVSIHRHGSAPSEAPYKTLYHPSPSRNGGLKGVPLPLLRLVTVLDLGLSPQSSDILCLSPFLPSSSLQRLDSHNQRPYQTQQPTCRNNRISTSTVTRVIVLRPPGTRKMAMIPTAGASTTRPTCSALEKSKSLRFVAHAPSISDENSTLLQRCNSVTNSRAELGYKIANRY